MTVAPNPGFALLLGALLALVLPRLGRSPAMITAALGAAFLMFERDFGVGPAFAQIGLSLAPLRLDPLAQVFGLSFALVAAALALFSTERDDRLEDVALMTNAGGATVAVFAGDLVSFVAGAQLSALAGVALVFAGRTAGARAAGVRMLCWCFLAGALMTASVGLTWAASGEITFERMAVYSPSGALMFLGLLILAGAPLAHVWIKDGAPHARAVGAAALMVFTLKLGAYGLARAFPGEPLLLTLGAVLAVGALPLALLAGDYKQSAAYGLLSQAGAAIALIGVGTPGALAASAALCFAAALHGSLAMLTISVACERAGSTRLRDVGGLAGAMPVTAVLAIVAGLSALAVPGLVGFAAAALAPDAAAREERTLLWLALTAASAGAALHIGGRLPLALFFGERRAPASATLAEPPYVQLLAMGLAGFFCVGAGVAPDWLYGFLPDEVFIRPYDWEHLVRQAELAAFALLTLGAVRLMRLSPADQGRETLDVDWLWRVPGAALLRALGGLASQGYAEAQRLLAALYRRSVSGAEGLARLGDRPAAPDASGLAVPLLVLTLTMLLLFVLQG